jgi:cytidine deaminase
VTSDDAMTELVARAKQVAGHAYAPYSNLHIGAALRTAAGNVHEGCNVENASYGLTWCAERTAVTSAVAAEGPEMRIEAVAVYTPDLETCSPCGACRQVLAEFAADAVIAYRERGDMVERSLRELLPHAFYAGADG